MIRLALFLFSILAASANAQTDSCCVQTEKHIWSYAEKSIVDLIKTFSLKEDFSQKIKDCYHANTKISENFAQTVRFTQSMELDGLGPDFWNAMPDDGSQKMKSVKKGLVESDRYKSYMEKHPDCHYGSPAEFEIRQSSYESSMRTKHKLQIGKIIKERNRLANQVGIGKRLPDLDWQRFENLLDELKRETHEECLDYANRAFKTAEARAAYLADARSMGVEAGSLDSLYQETVLGDPDFKNIQFSVPFSQPKSFSAKLFELSRSRTGSFEQLKNAVAEKDYEKILSSTDGFVRSHRLLPDKLGKTSAKLEQMNFRGTSKRYQTGIVYDRNEGLIHYISNELIPANPKLIETTSRFLSKMERPQASGDVYKLALDAARNDPITALETIAVFGHDDCCNELRPEPKLPPNLARAEAILSLQRLRLEDAYLFKKDSVYGLKVDPSLEKKIESVRQQWKNIERKHPREEKFLFEEGAFRSGQYHFYGGMFMATELVKEGLGKIGPFEIPEFLAQKTAVAYKYLNMGSYLGGSDMIDARKLYALGYSPDHEVAKPKGWTDDQYSMAKIKLDLNFLHIDLAEQQHALGAKFAVDKIRAWMKDKSCKQLDLRAK